MIAYQRLVAYLESFDFLISSKCLEINVQALFAVVLTVVPTLLATVLTSYFS
jgi:hypothetical protein